MKSVKQEMCNFGETPFTFNILSLRFIVIIFPAEFIGVRGYKRSYEISETENVLFLEISKSKFWSVVMSLNWYTFFYISRSNIN